MSQRADILVIKLSALGDFILAFPAFARIRAAHPSAPITLLTTPPFESLAAASPYFDRVWSDGRPDDAFGWLRMVSRVRQRRFARVYDLQTNDRTNLIFQALRPFPPAWSGTATGCSLPDRDPDRMRRHSLERQAHQLQVSGIWPDAPTAPMTAPPPDLRWLIGPVEPVEGPPLALLIPGSAPTRPLKRWPAERYGDLATHLTRAGFDVAILGSEAERSLADIIRQAAPKSRDLTGRTSFGDIARCGARASVAIGNDTGPTHIAAAAGAPTVALFSADSDPALSAPRGNVTVIRRDPLADLPATPVIEAAQAIARPQTRPPLARSPT